MLRVSQGAELGPTDDASVLGGGDEDTLFTQRFLKSGDLIALGSTKHHQGFLGSEGFSNIRTFEVLVSAAEDVDVSFKDCVFQVLPRQVYAAAKARAKFMSSSTKQEDVDYAAMLLTPPERAEPTPAVRAAALLERVKAQSGESKAGEELWANPLVAAGADRVVHALKTTTERRSDAELQAAERARAAKEEMLNDAVEKENAYNANIVRTAAGTVLKYGDVIQLLHVKSDSFLTVKLDSVSDTERNANVVTVGNTAGGSSTQFRIRPRSKVRALGDRVVISDQIVLESVKRGLTLHVSPHAQKGSASPGLEVTASPTDKFASWNVVRYLDHDSSLDKFIINGTTLRIQHLEHGDCLTPEDNAPPFHPEIFRNYLAPPPSRLYLRSIAESSPEYKSVLSLWEVESLATVDGLVPSGAAVSWETTAADGSARSAPVRFRHLITGRYLAVVNASDRNLLFPANKPRHPPLEEDKELTVFPLAAIPATLANSPDSSLRDATLFVFESTSVHRSKYVEKESVVRILSASHTDEQLFLSATKDDMDHAELPDALIPGGQSYTLQDSSSAKVDSFDSSRKEVSFSNSELSDTRAFRLHAAHTSEVQLIRSALSVRRALFQGLKTVFSGKPVRFSDWQRISHGVSEALSLLITISPGHDAIDCKDAVAKRSHQQLFREIRLIDHIVGLIGAPFISGVVDISALKPRMPVTNVVRLCYNAIFHLIKSSEQNALYVSYWLPCFIHHACHVAPEVDIDVEDMLKILLGESESLLESVITPDVVGQFVGVLDSPYLVKTERTLTLLRALCIHNGTPVVPNQESIRVRLFLSTPEALLLKLRIDTRAGLAAAPVAASDESVLAQSGLVEEKEVMILPTPDYFQEGSAPRWIPIREFIAESSEDYFGYFLTLVRLLSELCVGRNLLAIESVASLYPEPIILAMCAVSAGMTPAALEQYRNRAYDLSAAFVSLYRYSCLDVEPYHALELPRVSRPFPTQAEQAVTTPIIHFSPLANRNLEKAKVLVTQYLEGANFTVFSHKVQKNRLTIEVLEIGSLLVELGVFSSFEEIRSLLYPLVNLLSGFKDPTRAGLAKPKEDEKLPPNNVDRYVFTDETALTMRIKTIICHVISSLFSLDIDMRTTEFVRVFAAGGFDVPSADGSGFDLLGALRAGVGAISDGITVPAAAEASEGEKAEPLQVQQLQAFYALFRPQFNMLHGHNLLNVSGESPPDFNAILIDLMMYDDAKLVNAAFSVLLSYFSQFRDFSTLVQELQILDENKSALYNQIGADLDSFAEAIVTYAALTNQRSSGIQALSESSLRRSSVAKRLSLSQRVPSNAPLDSESIIVSTLTLLLERLVVPIAPPERVSSLAQSTEVKGDALRHLHPGQRHKEQPFERPGVAPAIVELVPILAEEKAVVPPAISSGLGVGGKLSGLLSAAAVVEGALEATFDPLVVFDFEMQTLLGNLNVQSYIVDLARTLLHSTATNPSAKAIVRACYLTLGGLAHKHAKNQERLWKNVKEPLLLAIGAGVAAEIALAEIMLDNRNIAEHVDERMYQALLKPVEESQCYDANLLTPILRSIKVDRKIVRKNQTRTLRVLLDAKNHTLLSLLGPLHHEHEHEPAGGPGPVIDGSASASALASPPSATPADDGTAGRSSPSRGGKGQKKPWRNHSQLMSVILGEGVYDDMAADLPPWSGVDRPTLVKFALGLVRLITATVEGKSYFQEAQCKSIVSEVDLCHTILALDANHPNAAKATLLNLFTHAYIDTESEVRSPTFHDNCWLIFESLTTDATTGSDFAKNTVLTAGVTALTQYFGDSVNIEYSRRHWSRSARTLTNALLAIWNTGAKHSNSLRLTSVISTLFKLGGKPSTARADELLQEHAAHTLRKASSKSRVSGDDEEPVREAAPGDWKAKLALLRENLDDSPCLDQVYEREFDLLTSKFDNIQRLSQSSSKTAGIPFSYMATRLIKLVSHRTPEDEDDVRLNPELSISGMRVLRGLIEIENEDTPDPALEWSDWEFWMDAVRDKQKSLLDAGIVPMLVQNLALATHPEMYHETLLTCIAMLVGGNSDVQKVFLKEMKKQSEGNVCETLFNKVIRAMVARRDLKKESKGATSHHHAERDEKSIQIRAELRFIQLLCEGHALKLQNYLRVQQVTGAATYDVVKVVGEYFCLMESHVTSLSFVELEQVIATLTDLCQGPCEGNQRRLLSVKVVESCVSLLSWSPDDTKARGLEGSSALYDNPRITQINQAVVTLLQALIEGSFATDIPRTVANIIHFPVLWSRLVTVYQKYFAENYDDPVQRLMHRVTLSDDDYSSSSRGKSVSLMEGFGLWILINQLADLNADMSDYIRVKSRSGMKHKKITSSVVSFFEENTCRVEVQDQREKLQRVYFPKPCSAKFLTRFTMDKLNKSIDRTTQDSKLRTLLDCVDEVEAETNHIYALNRRKWVTMLTSRLSSLKLFAFLLAVALNLMILLGYGVDTPTDNISSSTKDSVPWLIDHVIVGGTSPMGNPRLRTAITALGYILSITASFIFVLNFLNYGDISIRLGWRQLAAANTVKYRGDDTGKPTSLFGILTTFGPAALQSELQERQKSDSRVSTAEATAAMVKALRVFSVAKAHTHRKIVPVPLYLRPVKALGDVYFLITRAQVLYYLAFVTLAWAGTFAHPFFFAFHLLDIVTRYETLQAVLKSVTVNVKQLLMTALFMNILIYLYSLVGFIIFRNTFYDGGTGELVCETLYECFFFSVNDGLQHGGIGQAIEEPSFNNFENIWFGRMIFDLSFFAIIITIMLNGVVLGVIVNTFGQLRDAEDARIADESSFCLICGLGRDEFDRNGKGFNHHITHDHNMWQYLFFVIYLRKKEQTEMNGIESFVAGCLSDDKTDWLPMSKALVLHKDSTDIDLNGIRDLIAQLSNTVASDKAAILGALQQLLEAGRPTAPALA